MSKSYTLLAAFVAVSLITACKPAANSTASSGDKATDAAGLTTDAQKFGYAIGIDLGKSLQPVKAEVDVAALKQGLDDASNGVTPKMDDKAREEIKNTVAKKMQEEQMEKRMAEGKKAQEDGDKFLAENAKKPGVKTTASGLQYVVEKEGTGAHPKATDEVTVNYVGTLINGEKFDSSYDRNQPVTFPLNQVIPGWTEGLQLMTVGSKYKFFLPAKLAYGERGAGMKIGPNETLVFEVELLSIGKDKADDKKAAKK
ncbi:MAG TPA: FKBP-type peptidyl-prolyl cis-trans isomerase [Stenotrophobium sp.]|jgi:FKBP-type peptidyl-prolyl cis-trans isomerase|nr:FKBP-type peptidyl-prolyl cis-trans isomerase [Stenotrophobium sp.]